MSKMEIRAQLHGPTVTEGAAAESVGAGGGAYVHLMNDQGFAELEVSVYPAGPSRPSATVRPSHQPDGLTADEALRFGEMVTIAARIAAKGDQIAGQQATT